MDTHHSHLFVPLVYTAHYNHGYGNLWAIENACAHHRWPGNHSICPTNSGFGWPFDQSTFNSYFVLCIMIHTHILVKNSHRIQNQHLQFTLELSNDSQVTRTFAETRSGEYSMRCHKRNSYFGKIASPYIYYGTIINRTFARA